MSKLNSQPRLIFVAYFAALALISSLQTAHGYYVQISPSMQALADQYQQAVQQQQLTRQYTQSQIDYIKSIFQRLTLGTLGEEQRKEIEDFFDQYNEKVQQQQEQQQEYQQQLVEQQQYEQQTQKYQQPEEDDDDEKKKDQSTQQPQSEQQTPKYQQPEEDDDDEKQEQQTQQPQYEQQTQKYQQPEEDDDDEKQEQQTQQPQYEQQTQKYQQPEEDDDDEKQEQQPQQPQVQQQYEQQTQKYQQPEEDDDSTEDDCGGYKAFPNDTRFYLQFDGVNWLKRPCPEGLGFENEKCACVIRIQNYVTPSTSTATTLRTSTTSTTPSTTTMRTSTTSTTPSTTTTTRSTTTSTTPEPTITRRTTTTSTTTPQPTTTRLTTTGKPSLDLCRDCVMLHGVGYAPYPGHCDAYIQCQYYGDVPSSVDIRYCSGGLKWNQDKLTCDYPENVKCQSVVTKCPNKQAVVGDSQGYLVFNGYSWSQLSCPPNKVYSELACDCIEKRGEVYSVETCLDKKPISNDRTGFLQLSASGWIRMPCPRTLGYNAQTCRCTDYLNTDNQYTLCPKLKPIPGEKTGYLQFNGVSWLRMPCPPTVGYNPSTCQCSDYLTDDDKSESIDKDNDVCKPELILTFDDNGATDLSHNQFWINNTGVTFKNGQAHFDGSSKLTVPGFSNMDLGDTVYITVKYNQSGYGKQTIVTNGDCGVLQSFGICSDSESVDFFVETGSQQAKVLVPRMVNSWQYVMYSLHKNHLKGYVGTRSSTYEVKGSVARRQRGLVIGEGGECGAFTGVIDEIHVFLCYPGYA